MANGRFIEPVRGSLVGTPPLPARELVCPSCGLPVLLKPGQSARHEKPHRSPGGLREACHGLDGLRFA
jgi:hypothetical protein